MNKTTHTYRPRVTSESGPLVSKDYSPLRRALLAATIGVSALSLTGCATGENVERTSVSVTQETSGQHDDGEQASTFEHYEERSERVIEATLENIDATEGSFVYDDRGVKYHTESGDYSASIGVENGSDTVYIASTVRTAADQYDSYMMTVKIDPEIDFTSLTTVNGLKDAIEAGEVRGIDATINSAASYTSLRAGIDDDGEALVYMATTSDFDTYFETKQQLDAMTDRGSLSETGDILAVTNEDILGVQFDLIDRANRR